MKNSLILYFLIWNFYIHRVFVDLFVTNIEVTVARLNGARLPEPTDIPLRVYNKLLIQYLISIIQIINTIFN